MEPGQRAYEAVSAGKFADVHPAIRAQWATIEAAIVPPLPADVAGLVERLERRSPLAKDIAEEAASTIRALVAENERLGELAASWHGDAIDALEKLHEAVEVMRCFTCDCEGACREWKDRRITREPSVQDCVRFRVRAFLADMEKPHD
jgi:hypothetical protein